MSKLFAIFSSVTKVGFLGLELSKFCRYFTLKLARFASCSCVKPALVRNALNCREKDMRMSLAIGHSFGLAPSIDHHL
jgi:hypothetical protein